MSVTGSDRTSEGATANRGNSDGISDGVNDRLNNGAGGSSSNALNRLLRPRSIAVLGGSWASSVIEQCQRIGFSGNLWPVHPAHKFVHGLPCYPSVDALPDVPDATFIGVNRHLTIETVGTLSSMNAGGAVCFASGFSEASAEDSAATELQEQLLEAAGAMPLIGPNCYGMINYLDGALLWPDQHGGECCDRGIALITQSSNIAINLTMQRRGLPIAYVLTAGNQAQLSIGQLGMALLEDSRVTALALHIEGFGDIRAFELLAATARALDKPIVAVKAGRSIESQQAMVSHTNSLTGSDTAANAFLARLGIARVDSLSALLETLKLLHVVGPLTGVRIHSMSCSGGEAGLMADAAVDQPVTFPALDPRQQAGLREALGELVALNNPLDYHTYIWNDLDAMTAAYSAMLTGPADLSLLVNDFPRADRCDYPSWLKAVDALIAARDATNATAAMLSTLPENMPEEIAKKLMQANLVPLAGIQDAMIAIEAAAFLGASRNCTNPDPTIQLSASFGSTSTLTEAIAKEQLANAGLDVPKSVVAANTNELDSLLNEGLTLDFPLVLKGLGVAHKTEHNAVRVGLMSVAEVLSAAQDMQSQVSGFLLEEYVDDTVAELLVSVVRDPAHGFLLTLAGGGILTELLHDTVNLLLPFDRAMVEDALGQLRIVRLLDGYRGKPGADKVAIVDAVMAIQSFTLAHASRLQELEINPLLCRTTGAVVADALICFSDEKEEHE